MSTAPEDYRGRRRAPHATRQKTGRRRLLFWGALLTALGLALTVRALAGGGPEPGNRTAAESGGAGWAGPLPVGAPATRGSRPAQATGTGGAHTSHRPPAPGATTGPGRTTAPAPPPTSAPAPAPSPAAISYEAEAPGVVLGPGAEIHDVAGASGGQVVDGGPIRFADVAAEGGGTYPVVVYYLSPAPLTAQLTVDDGLPQPVTFPATDDQIATVTVRVSLLVGLNSLGFDNAPAIDRITVG
jgi:hypothetical protein